MNKQTLLLAAVYAIIFCLTAQTLQGQNGPQRRNVPYWSLDGNSNATLSSKLGTTNAIPLRLFTGNIERMRITESGRIGIGTTTPAFSALLDVSSTSKGVLFPRMTNAQMKAISSPAQGLLVFQTDGSSGYYYYDGGWKPVAPSFTGANTALSNLSATAINTHLLPNASNSWNLGSVGNAWKDFFLSGHLYLDGFRFITNRNLPTSLFVGANAGNTFSTGFTNIGIGSSALRNNSTGNYNVALGSDALLANTTGGGNTANGIFAFKHNTTGMYNTSIGFQSLSSNTTGNDNTATGVFTLYKNTTGHYNTALGSEALFANTIGNNNTAIGQWAMTRNTTGDNNLASGGFALYFNTFGYSNVANGAYALYQNTSGYQNTATGIEALYSNTTGINNTASGSYAMRSNTTGNYLTAICWRALFSNTSGGGNTAVGAVALASNTTGGGNTATGESALSSNTTGGYNTANGLRTLYSNTTGEANTAIGHNALPNNTIGSQNTAVGKHALFNNTKGGYNTSTGEASLSENTTGEMNTANGQAALFSNLTGSSNVAVGALALYYNKNGTGNTAVGLFSGVSESNLNNTTAIGFMAAVDASNEVRIGNYEVTSIGGQVSWSTFSDGRYKRKIKEDVQGLEFINSLRPITYTVDVPAINAHYRKGKPENVNQKLHESAVAILKESEEKASKVVYNGFIAQEVEEAAKKLNYEFSGVDKPESKDGLYGLRYSDFVVPLVKAVQELSKKADRIEQLEKEVQELKELVVKLSNGNSSLTMSSGYLEGNIPNPFSNNTTIRYKIPSTTTNAKLLITDIKGSVIKTFSLARGSSQITIDSNTLAAGTYTYSLWIDHQQVDSKKMVIAR